MTADYEHPKPEPVALKPCPFCGSIEAVRRWRENTSGEVSGHFVECCECSACGPVVVWEKEAITAWNRRAEPLADAGGVVEALETELTEALTYVLQEEGADVPYSVIAERVAAMVADALASRPQASVEEVARLIDPKEWALCDLDPVRYGAGQANDFRKASIALARRIIEHLGLPATPSPKDPAISLALGALEPFAQVVDGLDNALDLIDDEDRRDAVEIIFGGMRIDTMSVEDFRRAREALTALRGESGGT